MLKLTLALLLMVSAVPAGAAVGSEHISGHIHKHPVTAASHPVTTVSHPVTTVSHPVTTVSHPVITVSHPVTPVSHSGTTMGQPGKGRFAAPEIVAVP